MPQRPSDFASEKEKLASSVIAIPLLEKIAAEKKAAGAARRKKAERPPEIFPVIIDMNLKYAGGREAAKRVTCSWIRQAIERVATHPREQGVHTAKTELSNQYVFAS